MIDNIPRKEALNLIYSKLVRERRTEVVPLEESCGRVVCDNVMSRINLPDTPCSRWDGICFSYDAFDSCKGNVSQWVEGRDYSFSNTGIAISNNSFDTMVRIEDTVFENGKLKAIIQAAPVVRGQNIIKVGERMAPGEVLVAGNTRITPSHMNLMAGGFNRHVAVYAKPVVAIIPTGSELVSLSDTPLEGRTIESNTYSMRAKAESNGARAVVLPIQKDITAQIGETLLEAATFADLIVIGGGSGRGQHDLMQKALAEVGTLYFSSVEHGPGKRTCFAVVGDTAVIGLVGPPGGEEMTFDFYVVPAIKALLFQEHRETRTMAILDEDLPPHNRVGFYFTLHLYRNADGILHAAPIPHAGLDRNIAMHNAYLYVPKDGPGFSRGSTVEVEVRIGCEVP